MARCRENPATHRRLDPPTVRRVYGIHRAVPTRWGESRPRPIAESTPYGNGREPVSGRPAGRRERYSLRSAARRWKSSENNKLVPRNTSSPVADFVHGSGAVNFRTIHLASIATVVLTTWPVGPAHAQAPDSRPAFARLTIRAGALWQATDSRFSALYKPGTGYSGELTMPFDVGEFALALERATFTGQEPNPHPDFHGTVGMLKWRMPLPSVGRFTIAVGAHAGAMRFSFQDTAIAPGLRKEMEMLFGVNALGSVRLPANFSAFVMGEYTHVQLHVPLHLAPLTAGFGYTLITPVWLRDFLQ